AITFTNRAAREMRERVSALLSTQGRSGLAADLAISTFHSLGAKILRRDAGAIGLKPGFSILGPDDIEPIVAELIGTTDRARARAAQWSISRWKKPLAARARHCSISGGKTALVAPAAAARGAKDDEEASAAAAFNRYDETLRAWQAV